MKQMRFNWRLGVIMAWILYLHQRMLANKVHLLGVLRFALRLICIYFTGSVRAQ
uniref:Uncharacterized protein n=1 Tax=Arundo donax TaxID=35708 RepID=A0A0A8XRW5_ARUDO